MVELREFRHRDALLLHRFGLHDFEEADLPFHVLAPVAVEARQHLRQDRDHLPAVQVEAVEGTALDEALHRLAVEVPPVDAFQERVEARVGPGTFPLRDDIRNEVPPESLDRQQSEEDFAVRDGEPRFRRVHVGRYHFDAESPAFGDVLHHLVGPVQHAGDLAREELRGVMTFEVRGLVREGRIGRRVGFIEGIGREADHLVEDLVGGILRNAVLPAPGDEVHPLLFHDLVFLFGHGPSDDVRVAVRVPRQFPADLHDLLLVDHAPVGDI